MPVNDAKQLDQASRSRIERGSAHAGDRRLVNRLRGTLNRCRTAGIDVQHLQDRIHIEIDFMVEALRRG